MAHLTRLELRRGRQVFRLAEILAEVNTAGTRYRDSTIRTHISSRMCGNAPDHQTGNSWGGLRPKVHTLCPGGSTLGPETTRAK